MTARRLVPLAAALLLAGCAAVDARPRPRPTTTVPTTTTTTTIVAPTTTTTAPAGMFTEAFDGGLDGWTWAHGCGFGCQDTPQPSPTAVGVVNGQLKIINADQNYGDATLRSPVRYDLTAGPLSVHLFDESTTEPIGTAYVLLSQDPSDANLMSANDDNVYVPGLDHAVAVWLRNNCDVPWAPPIVVTYSGSFRTTQRGTCELTGPRAPRTAVITAGHVSVRNDSGQEIVAYDATFPPVGYVQLGVHNHASIKYTGQCCTVGWFDDLTYHAAGGAPPPTTTTGVTTSTSTAPTTTIVPTTSTTTPSTGCGLTAAAFCDEFSTASPGATPRGGDLSAVWGVSRLNTNWQPGDRADPIRSPFISGCGSTTLVTPDDDLRICNGQLFEATNDGDFQTRFSFYPKQPFDFTGRTGTFVFDSSTDTTGGHGAWPEFGITDQPIPVPSAVPSGGMTNNIRNGIWFSLAFDKCGGDPNLATLDFITIARNYVPEGVGFTATGCVRKGSAGGPLNHFEVRISQSHVEVWGSDPGGTNLHQLATANINSPITRGLVWISDVHYNASKDGYPVHATVHTFAWDNVGFDGPKTYRDLSYDVPESKVPKGDGVTDVGWNVGPLGCNPSCVLTVTNVHAQQPPTGALVAFEWWSFSGPPGFRVNGGPWHDVTDPFTDGVSCPRSIGVSVPLSETVEGTNTIEFRAPNGAVSLSNVNLILVAGAPVP